MPLGVRHRYLKVDPDAACGGSSATAGGSQDVCRISKRDRASMPLDLKHRYLKVDPAGKKSRGRCWPKGGSLALAPIVYLGMLFFVMPPSSMDSRR